MTHGGVWDAARQPLWPVLKRLCFQRFLLGLQVSFRPGRQGASRRFSVVTFQQAAEALATLDDAFLWRRFIRLGQAAIAHALVWALGIIMVRVILSNKADMVFAEENHLVENFSPGTSHERLGHCVQIRTSLG